jgi:hypothetical protein
MMLNQRALTTHQRSILAAKPCVRPHFLTSSRNLFHTAQRHTMTRTLATEGGW